MIVCSKCKAPMRPGEGHSLCSKCQEAYRVELRRLKLEQVRLMAADTKTKPPAPVLAQPKETK